MRRDPGEEQKFLYYFQLGMKWSDYEDAVQTATAERIGAEFIITEI